MTKIKDLLTQDAAQSLKQAGRAKIPNPLNDGKTHVNLNVQGKVDWARTLGTGARAFTHEVLGEFSNIAAYIAYVTSKVPTDETRNLRRKDALFVYNQHLTADVQALVRDAYWDFLKRNPRIREALKKSTLPFDCYYVRNSPTTELQLPVRPVSTAWLPAIMTQLREILQQGQESQYQYADYSKIVRRVLAGQEAVVEDAPVESAPVERTEPVAYVAVAQEAPVGEVVATTTTEHSVETGEVLVHDSGDVVVQNGIEVDVFRPVETPETKDLDAAIEALLVTESRAQETTE